MADLAAGWRFRRGEPSAWADRTASPSSRCAVDFCNADLDHSRWRRVVVPHDWSIEDLPSREEDELTPVLSLREGKWRTRRGDHSCWQRAEFNDSSWRVVQLPLHYRSRSTHDSSPAPRDGRAADATFRWLRRRFTPTAAQLHAARSGRLRISLGAVSVADEAFLNGERIGGIGSMQKRSPQRVNVWQLSWCHEAQVHRSHAVPATLLHAGENLIAVRIAGRGGMPPFLIDMPGGEDMRSGPFDAAATGSVGAFRQGYTGYTVGGIGWYRLLLPLRRHELCSVADGRRAVRLIFQAAYARADVWLNGHRVGGTHEAGYFPFVRDLTPYLRVGRRNLLAVRVENSGDNSRWYAGSGLIRAVQLMQSPLPLHLPVWAVAVKTAELQGVDPAGLRAAAARLLVHIRVSDAGSLPSAGLLGVQITAAGAAKVLAQETRRIAGNASVRFTLVVKNAALWSPTAPTLHVARVSLRSAEPISAGSEAVHVTFGIRSLQFSADQGFVLNGVTRIKLRGGCIHHDHGPLGGVSLRRAEERRIELLLARGYNALRTAHNPASPLLLEACDRLGMLVIEEAFDEWDVGKTARGMHTAFRRVWKEGLTALILRDRNHPSIIMWSIGNEIKSRNSPAQVSRARLLAEHVRWLDKGSGRPVTCALDNPHGVQDAFAAALDVVGVNYATTQGIDADHARSPQRIVVSLESYPHMAASVWASVEARPHLLGDFVWTAVDYLGEAAIGASGVWPPDPRACESGYCTRGWPYIVSSCGDLDVTGHVRPQARLRSVVWRMSMVELAVRRPPPPGSTGEQVVDFWGFPDEVDSWNWAEDQELLVRVYTRCDAVALLLNGRLLNTTPTPVGDDLAVNFTVRFVPGTLTAVGLRAGRAVANRSIITVGAASRLVLNADRTALPADPREIGFVTAEAVDASGRRVPDFSGTIKFRLIGAPGACELTAVGSADPTDVSSFRADARKAFEGRALAVLRPAAKNSSRRRRSVLTLRATSRGLQPGEVKLAVVARSQPRELHAQSYW